MKSSKQLRPSAPPRETEAAPTTALTVRACEIVFPKGVETLGEKANFLHAYSVEASKRSTGAAILAGTAAGVYASPEEGAKAVVKEKRRHMPDPSVRPAYMKNYEPEDLYFLTPYRHSA